MADPQGLEADMAEGPHNAAPSFQEEAKRLAESSCREQGLDFHITDPVVLGKIAAALMAPLNPAEREEEN